MEENYYVDPNGNVWASESDYLACLNQTMQAQESHQQEVTGEVEEGPVMGEEVDAPRIR